MAGVRSHTWMMHGNGGGFSGRFWCVFVFVVCGCGGVWVVWIWWVGGGAHERGGGFGGWVVVVMVVVRSHTCMKVGV